MAKDEPGMALGLAQKFWVTDCQSTSSLRSMSRARPNGVCCICHCCEAFFLTLSLLNRESARTRLYYFAAAMLVRVGVARAPTLGSPLYAAASRNP